jgi:hypothetical protein
MASLRSTLRLPARCLHPKFRIKSLQSIAGQSIDKGSTSCDTRLLRRAYDCRNGASHLPQHGAPVMSFSWEGFA